MRWLKTSTVHTCLLSAAAASALATPISVWAQTEPTSQSLQETAVQRELRRLYEESGREMPEGQQPQLRTQRPAVAAPQAAVAVPSSPQTQEAAPAYAPSTPTAPQQTIVMPNGHQAGAGGAPPAPSAPQAGSQNPISRFFRRIVPGGQSKPTPTPAPATVTAPAAPAANVPSVANSRPAAQGYAPYSGQQPRRLDTAPPIVPAVTVAPPSPMIPPAPTSAPAAASAPAATATVALPAAPPLPPNPAPVNPVPALPVAPALPGLQPAATVVSSEPEFAPPLVVEGPALEANPFEQPLEDAPSMLAETATVPESAPAFETALPLPPAAVAQTPVVAGDFPDPFPELSEDEADDDLDIDMSTPFTGLALDDEPEIDPFDMPVQDTTSKEGLAQSAPQETDPLLDLPDLPAPAAMQAPLVAESLAAPPLPVNSDPLLEQPKLAATPQVNTPEPESAPKLIPAEESAQVPLPSPTARPITHQPESDNEAKMALIRERGGMKGLKGFCPVTLRDDRELRDALTELSSSFRGQKFHFASEAAKQKFELDPARYVPAAYGADVVVLIRDKDVAEGSLDFAAWYKGKLYLFSGEETYNTFVTEPAKYSAPAGLE